MFKHAFLVLFAVTVALVPTVSAGCRYLPPTSCCGKTSCNYICGGCECDPICEASTCGYDDWLQCAVVVSTCYAECDTLSPACITCLGPLQSSCQKCVPQLNGRRRLQSLDENHEEFFTFVMNAHDVEPEKPGHISFDAFHAFVHRKAANERYTNSSGHVISPLDTTRDTVAAFFKSLDKNGDGFINLNEFKDGGL